MSSTATEVKNAVEAAAAVDVKNLETRVAALEVQAAGYVKAHVVYIVGALCLLIGIVAGHFVR